MGGFFLKFRKVIYKGKNNLKHHSIFLYTKTLQNSVNTYLKIVKKFIRKVSFK